MTIEIKKLIHILYTSEKLFFLIPYVRRITLIETLLLCSKNEEAYNIFLDNLSTSPFIPENEKNKLADLVFSNQFNILNSLLECKRKPEKYNRLDSFKRMVLGIFIKSSKIKKLDSLKKHNLGLCITNSISIEELKQLTLSSLESSKIFTNEEKELVANDILDNRFDLLLLPNRFDCEEIQRINYKKDTFELDECPICLGENDANIKLTCQHLFCKDCIMQWAEKSRNLDCPLCRTSFNSVNNYI